MKAPTIEAIRRRINKRREELRAAEIEKRKREFNRLPEEQRKAREAVGWSPYQSGEVIRRTCGE